jgi:diadenosine tetraphosphate (Ap4A) HIT family hydrolase
MAESSPFRHVSKSEHGPLIPARLPDCIICRQNDQSDSAYPVDIIAQNRLWLIHHMYCGPPAGSPPSAAWGNPGAQTGGDSDLPGHLLLHSQRHVHGPADFTDEEAGNFVFAVRHVERLLLEITQAERIYTVLIGETGPHLHAHLIPRYSDAQLAEMVCLWSSVARWVCSISTGQSRPGRTPRRTRPMSPGWWRNSRRGSPRSRFPCAAAPASDLTGVVSTPGSCYRAHALANRFP